MAESIAKPRKHWSGRRVFLMFFAFFVLIAAVNAGYIYFALGSYSGVVNKKPYETGLAYNKLLEESRNQPQVQQSLSYSDGMLRWSLRDMAGAPIADARVNGTLLRPVKEGYDLEVALSYAGDGVYEAEVDLPYKGLWQAHLKGQWHGKSYQIRENLIVR